MARKGFSPPEVDEMEWWQAWSVLGWHRPKAYWDDVEKRAEAEAEQAGQGSGGAGAVQSSRDLIRSASDANRRRMAEARAQGHQQKGPRRQPPPADDGDPPPKLITNPAEALRAMTQR